MLIKFATLTHPEGGFGSNIPSVGKLYLMNKNRDMSMKGFVRVVDHCELCMHGECRIHTLYIYIMEEGGGWEKQND